MLERENQLEAGRQEIVTLSGLAEQNAAKLGDLETETSEGKQRISLIMIENQALRDQLRDLEIILRENRAWILRLEEEARKKDEYAAKDEEMRKREAASAISQVMENSRRIQDLQCQLEEAKMLLAMEEAKKEDLRIMGFESFKL